MGAGITYILKRPTACRGIVMRRVRKNIDVIATFRDGKPPQPHRFRVRDRYDNVHVIRIGQIVNIEKSKVLGDEIWTYQCQGMVGNTERIYVIEFNLHHGRWQLVKI